MKEEAEEGRIKGGKEGMKMKREYSREKGEMIYT